MMSLLKMATTTISCGISHQSSDLPVHLVHMDNIKTGGSLKIWPLVTSRF